MAAGVSPDVDMRVVFGTDSGVAVITGWVVETGTDAISVFSVVEGADTGEGTFARFAVLGKVAVMESQPLSIVIR